MSELDELYKKLDTHRDDKLGKFACSGSDPRNGDAHERLHQDIVQAIKRLSGDKLMLPKPHIQIGLNRRRGSNHGSGNSGKTHKETKYGHN